MRADVQVAGLGLTLKPSPRATRPIVRAKLVRSFAVVYLRLAVLPWFSPAGLRRVGPPIVVSWGAALGR